MKNRVKVVVTGSAGNIGYALLFRLASGEIFGKDTLVDLNLLEIEPALPALEGVMMELEDCAFPTLGNMVATSDLNKGMAGVNYAILVGAMPRREGMERSDLLKVNGGIFGPQGKAINDNAADDVKVLVVGNPCNTNCLIAMNHAPDVPNDRFFAMTMLDQNRAVAQLAMKSGKTIDQVSRMIIWGNHSSTQYPDYYNALIDGKPAVDVINDNSWFTQNFLPTVQKRGAAVIQARGASSAASAANAALDAVKALTFDTESNQLYSMCACSQGQYGIDEGLIFSFPMRTEKGRPIIVEGIEHNNFGKEKVAATLEELRQERDAVKAAGLI